MAPSASGDGNPISQMAQRRKRADQNHLNNVGDQPKPQRLPNVFQCLVGFFAQAARKQFGETAAVKLRLGGEIEAGDHRHYDRLEKSDAHSEHAAENIGYGKTVAALDVLQNDLTGLRSLQSLHDARHAAIGVLHDVGEFGLNLRAEQITRPGDYGDHKNSGRDQGEGFRQLAPAHEWLGDKTQQYGNENGADDNENDIKQKPNHYRNECDRNEDYRPSEEFRRRQLWSHRSLAMQASTSIARTEAGRVWGEFAARYACAAQLKTGEKTRCS
jgi:hypothetical protein